MINQIRLPFKRDGIFQLCGAIGEGFKLLGQRMMSGQPQIHVSIVPLHLLILSSLLQSDGHHHQHPPCINQICLVLTAPQVYIYNFNGLQNQQLMAQSYEKVFKSPINTSISKNLYSFPKSQRFQPSKESPCKRSFYNLKKGSLEARTTTFGYGNKTDLINREGVPPPGSYDRNSDFALNQQRKRGFSFGNDKRTTFDSGFDLQNPGPGKYDRVFNNYSKISFSFRSKYEDPLERHKNSLGPGQYHQISALTSTGTYFNSKYKGSGCGKIGKSSRFDDERTLPPGSGKYNDGLAMNRTGTYFNSKIASNYVKSFEGTQRPPINEASLTPGPGSYYVFSEFALNSKTAV